MASDPSALSPGTASAEAEAPVRPFRFSQLHRAPPSLADALRLQAQRSRWWLAADGALVAYGLLHGGPAWVAAGVLAAAVPLGMTAAGHAQADRYQRLLRHHATGRWDMVRAIAHELSAAAARRPDLGFDLDLRLAGIAARDRGLPGALQSLEKWRPRCARRPGLFDGRLAAVYLMAGDTAGHVAAMERAFEADPGQPVRQLDLALAQARFGDIERAQAQLADIDLQRLPEPGTGYADWARGLVELRRGQPTAAATLGRAVQGLATLAEQPAGWITLAACVCDHAVALHQRGQDDEARRLVAEVWPVLEHHATVPLLRMLEADGLLPAHARPNT